MAAYEGPARSRDEADNQTPDTVTHESNQSSNNQDLELSTSILNHPPELMVKIFSQLSYPDKVSVARVCSCWRKLIDDPSLWSNFRPILSCDNLTPAQTEKMNNRRISNIEISIDLPESMNDVMKFLQEMPHIKKLSLIVSFYLLSLHTTKENFSSIEHFTLQVRKLNANGLQSFLQPMVSLQDFTLICLPDEDMLCAVKYSKHLVSLHIKCLRGVMAITGAPMDDLNPISSLKRLSLENVLVGNSGVDFISRAFPQLCSLDLRLSPDVTFAGLKKLTLLKKLRDLAITSLCVQHFWIADFQTEMPQLENFNYHI